MDRRIEEIEEALNHPDFLVRQKNGLLLNQHQIRVLEENDIAWQQFSNMHSLLFYLEEILLEEKNDSLEKLSQELEEYAYYHESRK